MHGFTLLKEDQIDHSSIKMPTPYSCQVSSNLKLSSQLQSNPGRNFGAISVQLKRPRRTVHLRFPSGWYSHLNSFCYSPSRRQRGCLGPMWRGWLFASWKRVSFSSAKYKSKPWPSLDKNGPRYSFIHLVISSWLVIMTYF